MLKSWFQNFSHKIFYVIFMNQMGIWRLFRTFRALASVEMTISLIYCFMGYARYSEDSGPLQRLYDRACVITYGVIGIAAGIFGVIGVNAGNVL